MFLPNSDLHTHTTFCDGKNTPEEMVLAAIEKGMDTIGFSGHAYTPVDPAVYYMTPDKLSAYCKEITRLKDVYKGQINVLLGTERDYYSPIGEERYDYVIGSVHEVYQNGNYVVVDSGKDTYAEKIKTHFGDPFEFVRKYYETVADVYNKTKCDVIGHFDLITVFNESVGWLDENAPKYRKYALEAVDALLERDVVFEINTGAIARGYRSIPYPSAMILHRIAEKRGRVTLNSDSHRCDTLMYGFREGMNLARACGIGSVFQMTENGWKQIPIRSY